MARLGRHVLIVIVAALACGGLGAAGWAFARVGPITAGLSAAIVWLAAMQLYGAMIFTRRTQPNASLDDRLAGIDARIEAAESAQKTTEDSLARLAVQLSEETVRRNEAAVAEMRTLRNAVEQMAKAFQARIEEARANPAPAKPRPEASLLGVVRAALDDNRVELHLQPIVTLPQRRAAFYEAFTRIRDAEGRAIMPAEFMRVAEPSGLMGEIDNLLLFRCVQIVRRLLKQDRRVGVFCNISATSLGDEAFFPSFLGYMRENRDLAGALIFEMSLRAFQEVTPTVARNMGRLFDLGFRFSVDRADTVDLDLRTLERAGVRYVKIAGALLHEELVQKGARPQSGLTRDIEARDVPALFARYGLDLIADRIEDERTVIELLDLEIGYGQGHLFGAPRPIKEQVYEESGLKPPQRMAG